MTLHLRSESTANKIIRLQLKQFVVLSRDFRMELPEDVYTSHLRSILVISLIKIIIVVVFEN